MFAPVILLRAPSGGQWVNKTFYVFPLTRSCTCHYNTEYYGNGWKHFFHWIFPSKYFDMHRYVFSNKIRIQILKIVLNIEGSKCNGIKEMEVKHVLSASRIKFTWVDHMCKLQKERQTERQRDAKTSAVALFQNEQVGEISIFGG